MLEIRLLSGVTDVNHYRAAVELPQAAGDSYDLHLQLVDASQATAQEGYQPPGLRYVPASGATLSVQFKSVDDARQFSRFATQPFPTTDPSIWKVAVNATDPLAGTVDIQATLTEGSRVRRAQARAALLVDDGARVC